jgi:dTDP-glucose 4,6-dehydratase
MKVLIYGGRGWIGKQFIDILQKNNHEVILSNVRVNNYEKVSEDLKINKPDIVLSCLGRTYGPGFNTIDYLEQPGNLQINLNDNLFAPVTIANACITHNIYFVYLGTGCIFNSDTKMYTEDSEPDFFGSSYSLVKGFTDKLFHSDLYKDKMLNLRIRMPIVGEEHKRNFITKIVNYEKVVNIPNSMTVFDTLLPCAIKLIERKWTGTLNFTNPGTISHNQILDLYTEIVDPLFTYTNFTIEEQDKILASKRSNNHLDTSLLKTLFPNVPDIYDSVKGCLLDYKHSMEPDVVLVTGGCGFIGGAMVRYLYKHYPKMTIINIDKLTYCSDQRNITPEMKNDDRYIFYQVDITDEKSIQQIFQKHSIKCVLHFAAETHVDRSFEHPLEFTKTNIIGTQILLHHSHLTGVKKFIHVSTDEVYGDVNYSEPVKETSNLNPTNPYSGSKLGAEVAVTAFAKSFKLPYIITRCNNVYGPKQYHEKVIPKFSKMSMNGEKMTIHGNGSNVRSFIFIDDVTRAFDTIMRKGRLGEIYNIAVNNEVSIVDLSKTIADFFTEKGYDVPNISFVEDRPFNDERYFINSNKLEELGWNPEISFKEGIKRSLIWYENQDWN